LTRPQRRLLFNDRKKLHMRNRGTLCWIAGATLWAAFMIVHPAHPQNTDGDVNLPLLYGVQFVDRRITVDVVSHGCTDESSFAVKVDALPDALQLSIVQVKPDRCRMSPHIVSVTLSIPAVAKPDEAKFKLLNRLAIPGVRLKPAR
jgi:hypothetical protein